MAPSDEDINDCSGPMKRFPVLICVILHGAVAAPAAAGEGFSSQPPVVRDISPVMDGDPYYECARYGYQLSQGACAPGWPPPSEGWAGGAPEVAGRGGGWRPGQDYLPPNPVGAYGTPAGPSHEPGSWRTEAIYPWGPDPMEWGRAGIPDGPGWPWTQAAPGWGRAGQAIDAPPSGFPPDGARRGRAPDGLMPGGRARPSSPFQGDRVPWDPWIQDSTGDTRSIPPDLDPATEPEPQPAEPLPMEGPPLEPGAPSHNPAGSGTLDDVVPASAGVWDPLP